MISALLRMMVEPLDNSGFCEASRRQARRQAERQHSSREPSSPGPQHFELPDMLFTEEEQKAWSEFVEACYDDPLSIPIERCTTDPLKGMSE